MAKSKANAKACSEKDYANFLEEWKQARDVLKSFDEKLHDLRKYGFSFLTALFTAEAIFIPSSTNQMKDIAKFSVFAITILLIVAIHLLDRNYVAYQRAAATRAKVLERKLNLELSQIISLRYKTAGIRKHELVIYFFLIAGVFVLGLSVLNSVFTILLIIFVFLAYGYIFWQNRFIKFQKQYCDDWIISPLECAPNESVTVTVTNLTAKTKKVSANNAEFKDKADLELAGFEVPDPPLIFSKGELILEIISQEDCRRDPIPILAKKEIKVYDSYSMILKHSDFKKKGLYKIRPRGRFIPLSKTIVVSD